MKVGDYGVVLGCFDENRPKKQKFSKKKFVGGEIFKNGKWGPRSWPGDWHGFQAKNRVSAFRIYFFKNNHFLGSFSRVIHHRRRMTTFKKLKKKHILEFVFWKIFKNGYWLPRTWPGGWHGLEAKNPTKS